MSLLKWLLHKTPLLTHIYIYIYIYLSQVEEKPDVTYSDVGGCTDQIEKLKEVVELPLLHPERFVTLGIDPPKGVLLFGPPGTGKTLCARAVANRTDACFIRVIGSELVQKYVGEGARMVRELFEMARSKKACIIFFDEIDAIGGTRLVYMELTADTETNEFGVIWFLTQLTGGSMYPWCRYAEVLLCVSIGSRMETGRVTRCNAPCLS